jgi:hypothetical protein
MSSMGFNSRLGKSHHGPPHPFKDAGVVADSLTGIHNAMTQCLFVVNLEDSNQADVVAVQWVLLYLSIGHDTCY